MFSEEDVRPIIIFQTDGDEIVGLKIDSDAISLPTSTRETFYKIYGKRCFGFSDVKEAVEKSRATIYSIIPGLRFIGHSKEEQMNFLAAEPRRI